MSRQYRVDKSLRHIKMNVKIISLETTLNIYVVMTFVRELIPFMVV